MNTYTCHLQYYIKLPNAISKFIIKVSANLGLHIVGLKDVLLGPLQYPKAAILPHKRPTDFTRGPQHRI